ncbi:hypothetical protein GCM10010464_87810 [Pseudonocardia yunnanensis]
MGIASILVVTQWARMAAVGTLACMDGDPRDSLNSTWPVVTVNVRDVVAEAAPGRAMAAGAHDS